MQPVCFFVGKVSKDPKRIEKPGKQPFIAFALEANEIGGGL